MLKTYLLNAIHYMDTLAHILKNMGIEPEKLQKTSFLIMRAAIWLDEHPRTNSTLSYFIYRNEEDL